MQKLTVMFIIIFFLGIAGVVLAREFIAPKPDNTLTVAESSDVILAGLSAIGEVNITSTRAIDPMPENWDLLELSAQGYVNVVIDDSSTARSPCTFELQEIAAEGFVTISSCR